MPTIKSFQPLPHLALPTLQLGTQIKALAATGTITPLSAISTKINLNLATLLALGKKTLSWLCYKNKDSRSFSWRVALSILRPKCKVLLSTVNSPVLHTTKQAGAWHWIKHLSHIPWLWLLFNSTLPISNSHQTKCKNKQKEKGTETIKPD